MESEWLEEDISNFKHTARGGKSRRLFRKAESDQPLDEASHYQAKYRCLRAAVEHALAKATCVGKPRVGDTRNSVLLSIFHGE